MLVAIDTSTHYASLALHDGTRLVAEHTWLANQDHTRTLLPFLQGLLAGAGIGFADLSAVAVALGPGSFSGLRVGLSTAKGFAMARGLPLVGIPTLELLAVEYGLEEATMNAGRGRVYRWTRASGAGAEVPGAECRVPSADEMAERIQLIEGSAPDRVRHAGVLAELGWRQLRAGHLQNPAKMQPIYVQPPHITARRTANPHPGPHPDGQGNSAAA